MDYYYKYLKYKQKYLSLKDSFMQSDTSNKLVGGKRRSKKNKREVSNQLEITILKQGIKSDKVLSCSYFTMKDAYRQVEKYQNNLRKFLESKKQLKGFETRIYTDDSGKEFILELTKNDPSVSVYHFNFQPLREEIGHIGTFGTYMRFHPLFEKGLKIVWVSDIDIPHHYLDYSIISDAQKENAEFCYRSYVCYERKIYGRIYTILAGTIISFITLPEDIFYDFLNQLVSPSKKLSFNLDKLNIFNQSHGKPLSKIPYGFDEIFTNQNIYDYLIKNSIICYILKDYMHADTYLKHNNLISKEESELIYTYYKYQSKDLFHKVKKIFKEKLPFISKEYECLHNMLKETDSFKQSFEKRIIRKGKELNKEI
jgi:hypothetical protein